MEVLVPDRTPEPGDWDVLTFHGELSALDSPDVIADEVELYHKQDRFTIARKKREEKHKEEIRLIQERFQTEERKRLAKRVATLGWHLLHRGVEKTRRLIVPAYSFDDFEQLPTELRLRVWSFASRFGDPQTHLFESSGGSSRSKASISVKETQVIPSVLYVCRESRAEALKVFTLLPFTGGWGGRYSKTYFNTLYDSFYLGHTEIWKDFRLLIDILIKHNTTRALPPTILPDMEQFQEIRHLIVDLRIFGAMPPKTWTEFPNLESLTIAFYPFDEDEDAEIQFFESYSCPRRPGFVTAHPRNWCGLHAKRLLEHVRACLDRAQDEVPEWKKPNIEVKQRRVSSFDDHDPARDRRLQGDEEEEYRWLDELDDDDSVEVEYDVEEVIDEGEDQGEDNGQEDDNEAHDRTLKPQMPFEVPMMEIRRCKHKFHPSRRATTLDVNGRGRRGVGKDKKRCYGQLFTDSETEYGGASNHADYDSW